MSKLISQGGYGCVYHPGFDANNSKKTDEETVVKLQHKSAVSKNEIKISKIIVSIPHYTFYFAPILKTEPIKIGEIDSKLIKSCKPIAHNMGEEFVLMTVPYVNKENYFDSIINIDNADTRSVLTQYIDSYTFLLSSIDILIKQKIIHYDIKDDNIVYNRLTRNPIIIDFGISILIDDLNSKTWSQYFYVFAPEYYIWCLEIHFICYLVQIKDILDIEDITMVCNNYINSCPIFSYFSPEFKEQYINGAIQFYRQYVDMDKDKVIKDLLETWDTWDNYSLSILNLRVLSYLFNNSYSVNDTIIYLIELYLQNIHFDGKRRLSVQETKDSYKKIYNQETSIDNIYSLLTTIKPKRIHVKSKIKEDKLIRSSIN
tara:strand:- start:3738 stop:4853 length:1116 start_codon:yes stop_codon:yes gene_type:complete